MLRKKYAFFIKYNWIFFCMIIYVILWNIEIPYRYESDEKVYKWPRAFINFFTLPRSIYKLIKRNLLYFRNEISNWKKWAILIMIFLDYRIIYFISAIFIMIFLIYFLTFSLVLVNLFINKQELSVITKYLSKLCWSTLNVWYLEIRNFILKITKPTRKKYLDWILYKYFKKILNLKNLKENSYDFACKNLKNLKKSIKKYYKRFIIKSREKGKVYSIINKPFTYWFVLELDILYYRIKSLILKIMKILHSYLFKRIVSKLYDIYVLYNDHIYLEWYFYKKERGFFFEFSIEFFTAYFMYLWLEFVEYIKDTIIILEIDIKRYLSGMLKRWIIVFIYSFKIWIALEGVNLFLNYIQVA